LLTVIMLSVVMMSVVMMSVIVLNFVILRDAMLTAVVVHIKYNRFTRKRSGLDYSQ
jgi:hypothetical protein